MASSSSNLTASSALSASPPTSLIAVHHLITIKLTRDNYLLWKAQIVPYLRGQHLFAFLDGSRPAPPPSLPTQLAEATALVPNPEFQAWHLQDQLILSALISSLSKNILAHVVKCSTSHDVTRLIADYFHRFTNLADTLATVVDHPLNDFEMISFLLAGLGSDYDSFVTSVNTRAEPLSIEDLYGHLLAHELRLIQNQPSVDLSVAAANYAHKGFPPRGGRGGNSNMQALLATPQPQYDNNWYSDTGATHHLTSDLSNLNVHADNYTGTEQICVGSGNMENTAPRAE
uniref:Uncharacterized protein n=1 Tax=Fagus sylvatica TaxID=28930 RepID=A0A2N9J7Y7_FAGSY